MRIAVTETSKTIALEHSEFDKSINFVLAMQLKATYLVIVLLVTTRPFPLPITSTLFSKLLYSYLNCEEKTDKVQHVTKPDKTLGLACCD